MNGADSKSNKYRKLPVVIDALQWTGDNWRDVDEFITTEHDIYLSVGIVKIPTLEGTMDALPGDFIIKGINGEFYPCKPDIFARTYERVEDE